MNSASELESSLDPAIVREAAARALGEDLGPADITSMAVIPKGRLGMAQILTREACILSGIPMVKQVFAEVDPAIRVSVKAHDGDFLSPSAPILEVTGPVRGILSGERTALNFLQQLSAVATRTRAFVDAVAGTKTKILDTRKTVPGLRALQKYAVRCGGGFNHRMGLFDQFLLKDNHLVIMGRPDDWKAAVDAARALKPEAKIEIEAETLEQVTKIADLGVDMIMLDNMSIHDMRAAMRIIAGRIKVEASGNMTLERVRAVAEAGVDFISVGALTHSVQAIDMTLEMLTFAPTIAAH